MHTIGFWETIKQVWATVWTFLAQIRSYSMIIVECFYFIKFALNKASQTKWDAVSEIMKSAFESKDIHTTQTCINEDYDDSNDNDFVARLIVKNNPLDIVTHLLNQR